MTVFEYKVIPAPSKGHKAPGVKGAEARFAHTLETEINALAAEGWAYLRSDILPSEERQGLTSSHTVYRSVLVFQRPVTAKKAADDDTPRDTSRKTTPDPAPGPDTDTVEKQAVPDNIQRHDTPPQDADLSR